MGPEPGAAPNENSSAAGTGATEPNENAGAAGVADGAPAAVSGADAGAAPNAGAAVVEAGLPPKLKPPAASTGAGAAEPNANAGAAGVADDGATAIVGVVDAGAAPNDTGATAIEAGLLTKLPKMEEDAPKEKPSSPILSPFGILVEETEETAATVASSLVPTFVVVVVAAAVVVVGIEKGVSHAIQIVQEFSFGTKHILHFQCVESSRVGTA